MAKHEPWRLNGWNWAAIATSAPLFQLSAEAGQC